MARTQSERYPEIKLGILRGAAKLFANKGYARTTIADLADAMTSSRGALYHYFDSKESILKAIILAHIGDMAGRVEAAIGADDTPNRRCKNMIHAMVTLNTESQNEATVLMDDLRYLDKRDRKRIIAKQNRIVDLVVDVLHQADTAKRLTERTGKPYAMMLLGMLNYIYTWYDPDGPVPPAEFADMVADVFLGGFQAPRG